MKVSVLVAITLIFPQLLLCPLAAETISVVDAHTGRPIPDVIITTKDGVLRSDGTGVFSLNSVIEEVGIRAVGYERLAVKPDSETGIPQTVALRPVTPRALYLSVYGIGESLLRKPALSLIESTVINALVIDIKGDKGLLPYRSMVRMSDKVGAVRPYLAPDLVETIRGLKKKGVYTIARIVVFKDNLLAEGEPELALKRADGTLWRDREGQAWTAPYFPAVWEYNIAIAEEAARMGFDEIQFDYVRFPDEPGVSYGIANTETNRVNSIVGFLKQARKQLQPYNVFISADLFGYVFWNENDTYIGQRLKDLLPYLDYLSPMLYPSGFQHGIPDYPDPVKDPYAVVYYTLKRGQNRTDLPAVRFRPWLQAFKDYAFDRRQFDADEVRSQINAADDFGSHGWMLWNPRNVYPLELFETKGHDWLGVTTKECLLSNRCEN